jgi:hypothetical protein
MFLGGKGPARKADNLTAICEPIVEKMWEPRRLTTLWASTACYRDSFTFFRTFHASTLTRYSVLHDFAWESSVPSGDCFVEFTVDETGNKQDNPDLF